MLQPRCLPSSQTFILISAPQWKVSWGLPAAPVLAPDLQAARPQGSLGEPALLPLLHNYHHPAV